MAAIFNSWNGMELLSRWIRYYLLQRTQNSSIHILECLLNYIKSGRTLHWKNVFLQCFGWYGISYDRKGIFWLYLPAWLTPVPLRMLDAVRKVNFGIWPCSFGHDVETAYLCWRHQKHWDKKRYDDLRIAKKMVDHALQYGWDKERERAFWWRIFFQESSMQECTKHKRVVVASRSS